MAKKLCDLCQQSPATDMRFGVNLCNNCSHGYDKAVLGDPSFAAQFSNPANFPNATPSARKNIIAFVAKRSNRADIVQEIKQETAETKQQRNIYTKPIEAIHKENVKNEEKTTVDDLYIDIGKKIKGWAKWIFIVEAIASVIGAIIMLFTAEDGWMIFAALIALVVGPMLAWVSSWILYAFGELVDKTCANERNTQSILKILSENNAQNNKE